MLGTREAYLLGFLANAIRSHFVVAEALAAARASGGALGGAATEALRELPKRGPAVVSCVMELESIFAANGLSGFVQPRTLGEQGNLAAAAANAPLASSPLRASFEGGRALGVAYAALDALERIAALRAVAPADRSLDVSLRGASEALASASSLLDAARGGAAVLRPLAIESLDDARRALLGIDLGSPALASSLASKALAASVASRGFDAAVTWPSPREAARAYLAGDLPVPDLLAAWFAHPAWRTPVEIGGTEGFERRIFRFGHFTASFAASDGEADEALRRSVSRGEPWETLTTAGSAVLAGVPDVDVLQIDAYVEPTTHYARKRLDGVRAAGREATASTDVVDWMRIDPARVAAHGFFLLPAGAPQELRSFRDANGSDLLAVFTSHAAVDAYLAANGAPDAASFGGALRIPGSALFAKIADAKDPFVIDPRTPAARRFSPGFAALAASFG